MADSIIDQLGIKHSKENWKNPEVTGDNPWLYADDLNLEGWKNWFNETVVGIKNYEYKGLPENATYKDYMFELQKSREPSRYNLGKVDETQAQKILADIERLFPDRGKDDDASKGRPNMREISGDTAGKENKIALAKGEGIALEKEVAEQEKILAEREAFLQTPKGRMQTLFNDADKRDAILGGIADAMLETRVGADAYGSRFARAQKNVRENLKLAEATDIARQQAQLDMMKTLAETEKLTNPAQYLTDAQQNADSIVRAKIADGQITQDQYANEYARTLKQITVKDLTSAKAGAIQNLYTYAMTLAESDPTTSKILLDAIKSNAIYLAGGDGTVEMGATEIDARDL